MFLDAQEGFGWMCIRCANMPQTEGILMPMRDYIVTQVPIYTDQVLVLQR
jgi:hypothetical protein